MWGKYVVVGVVALLVGVLCGMLVLALRPVEQPAITVLTPVGVDNARRVVIVNPRSGSVTLYEVLGGMITELDRARY